MFGIPDLILLLSLIISFIIVTSRIYFTKMGSQEYVITVVFALGFLFSYKIFLIILSLLAQIIIPFSLVVVEISVLSALYVTIWLMGLFKGSERYASRVKAAFGSVILGFLIYSVMIYLLQIVQIV